MAWSVAAALTVITARRWYSVSEVVPNMPTGAMPAAAQAGASPLDLLVQIADRIVARNPFRLERRPTAVRFMAEPPVPVASTAPTPPQRPELRVTGIVGPPWQAILEGVPGRDAGLVVRAGQTVEGLEIRRIDRTTVVISGLDTIWTLAVRRPWP